MVSSLTVAVLTVAFALPRGIRRGKKIDEGYAQVADSGIYDGADIAHNSTYDDELQLTHEEEMQLVSDQKKFKTEINQYRQSLGLSTLCYNSALNTAAKNYARLLKEKNVPASHIGPDGSCHSSRTVAAGYCYSRVGECGGGGRKSVVHMFNGWRNSPTHDRVMKGAKYNEMGLWCNPRSYDPKYRCMLLLASHSKGNKCCMEDGCTQKREKCCGSGSRYPNRPCTHCCDNSKKEKFRICGGR